MSCLCCRFIQNHAAPKRAGAEFLDFLRNPRSVIGKLRPHRRGQVDHLQALGFEADFLDQAACVSNPSFCVGITFQVMAVAGQSTGDEHAVGPIFKSVQDVQYVHAPAA